MKAKIILFMLFTYFTGNVNCQITKGNWLVGGNAKGSISNSSLGGSNYKTELISISPNIGFFMFDKFSSGVKFSFDFISNKYPSGTNGAINYSDKYTTINIGPFIRYYFLETEKLLNIFLETSYQIQSRKTKSGIGADSKQNSSLFSISAGPVIYFNSTVGIEFLLGYNSTKYSGISGTSNSIYTGIGLQVHLKKDNN